MEQIIELAFRYELTQIVMSGIPDDFFHSDGRRAPSDRASVKVLLHKLEKGSITQECCKEVGIAWDSGARG